MANAEMNAKRKAQLAREAAILAASEAADAAHEAGEVTTSQLASPEAQEKLDALVPESNKKRKAREAAERAAKEEAEAKAAEEAAAVAQAEADAEAKE